MSVGRSCFSSDHASSPCPLLAPPHAACGHSHRPSSGNRRLHAPRCCSVCNASSLVAFVCPTSSCPSKRARRESKALSRRVLASHAHSLEHATCARACSRFACSLCVRISHELYLTRRQMACAVIYSWAHREGRAGGRGCVIHHERQRRALCPH